MCLFCVYLVFQWGDIVVKVLPKGGKEGFGKFGEFLRRSFKEHKIASHLYSHNTNI